MLRISLTNNNITEYLDLPQDAKLSIVLSNPYFGYSGSYSLPITLPATAKNLRLLKYPNRIDRYNFKSENFSVMVEYGLNIESGTLSILSYSHTEGIEITILLGKSTLTDRLGESTLADIMGDEILYDESNIDDSEERAVALIKDVCRYNYGYQNKLSYFPVAIEGGIINEPLNTSQPSRSEYDFNLLHPKTMHYNIHREVEEGVEIDYPKGYFFSPFIKVWYVLRKILEYAGYVLSNSNNCFYDSEVYGHLCLLNNNVDSCMGDGKLYTRHLVPDITAMEFLEEMQTLFGATVFLSGNNARIIFSRNHTDPVADWTDKMGGYPSISYGKKSQVALKIGEIKTNTEDFIDTETESVQKREANFKKYGITDTDPFVNPFEYAGGSEQYYALWSFAPFAFYVNKNSGSELNFFSAFLNYIPDSADNLDLTSKLNGYEVINVNLEVLPGITPLGRSTYLPYIGKGNNVKMNFTYTPSSGEPKDGTLTNDCPFMLAYDRQQYSDLHPYEAACGLPTLNKYNDPLGVSGKKLSEVKDIIKPLIPYCLVDNHTVPDNGHTVTVKMNFKAHELNAIDMAEPVTINGKICYISQIRLEASGGEVNVVDFTFKTDV